MNDALNRRQFLQHSATSGAALAVWSGAAALRAAESAPQSANDKLVVAMMGLNNRGTQLVPSFAGAANVEVAYICDVEDGAIEKGLAAVAKRQDKTPQIVRDVRRVLDDKAVDILVVATPDHWHGPATIMACGAGKHVYVEKPASHNGRESQWMVAAAHKNKRVVQLGTQRRSSPEIIAAIQRVRSGEFGRVLLARGWTTSARGPIGHGKPVDVPKTLDFSLWQGPAPLRPYVDNLVPYNWHWFWNWGTGEMGNNGIHALDICRWGMGVDYPEQIVCGGGRYFFEDDQETPDTQLATFNFGNKAITCESRTWSRQGIDGEPFGAAFYGDNGTLVIGSKVTVFDAKGKQTEQTPIKVSNETHLNNFFAAIRQGESLNAPIDEGVKSTDLCHLANIAYRTGHALKFDPDKREIVGDSAAADLWKREYREGWEPQV